ncbi:putative secreted protein (Por secretion system target) [Mariniflexile fucanivorans]|uniref:Putative secreted protein (Por secretion system target) n=1 Tax=Mariniflexile fucanivorans TaxID=264023 RepID=A0A4R1RJ50_9FLAO|nr:CotH kinase family protein [Mariniflexile fucanivorans]TCL66145.1 putative secreted protein (Por secretion system target) [Mariniflexile fucanivorans]
MKKITFLFAILSINLTIGQSFYDLETIQTIEITFAASNWDALLDAAESTDEYIEAQSVSINGTVFSTVGAKYKGNSSYSASNAKNPWHLELDTYVDQDYQGYTDIKLNNMIFDPSMIRETLGYKVLGNYMDVPLANYAKVYVNGTYLGLYTNVESISKKFVDSRFGSKTNAFFDCSPPDGATPQSTNLPNLAYLGTNSTSYESAYEMKSEEGWDDLIALTYNLSTTTSTNTANIEAVLDVDRALWMLAFDNVFVNLDSYIGQFKQNYYLYKSDNGQFNPIVWDLNMSFGVYGSTGSSTGGPGGSTLTTASKKTLSHTLHASETAWPLVNKFLAIPSYKKRYLAHYKTILTEVLSNSGSEYYLTDAQAFQTLITDAVTADTNLFSYQSVSNMSANLASTDISVTNNTAPGITALMSARNTYLTALSDFTNTQPSITSVTPLNTSPAIGGTVSITANVTNTTTTSVYLGYRSSKNAVFVKVLMYDDGAHDDGSANDNVYGVSIPVNDAAIQYYIYAENTNIGAFSPARAEYEYYSIDATYPTIAYQELVVNEIMASNTATVTDLSGKYEDWFELYNNTANTLSLDNLYASDSSTDLLKWQFPTGTTIEPYSYLVVWADSDTDENDGLHADFKFSASGENCILSYADGTIVDAVTFGAQTADMGYARNPNGTGDFVIQSPTYNANNETSLGVGDIEISSLNLKLYPNSTANVLNIVDNANVVESIKVYNLQGQALFAKTYSNENNITIDLSGYSNGMYVVNVNNRQNFKVVKR